MTTLVGHLSTNPLLTQGPLQGTRTQVHNDSRSNMTRPTLPRYHDHLVVNHRVVISQPCEYWDLQRNIDDP